MHWRIVEGGMEFGWLFIVTFVVLIILGIAHSVNLVSGRKVTHGESPLHVLKKRYARGELTKEEFEKMKDEITQDICQK